MRWSFRCGRAAADTSRGRPPLRRRYSPTTRWAASPRAHRVDSVTPSWHRGHHDVRDRSASGRRPPVRPVRARAGAAERPRRGPAARGLRRDREAGRGRQAPGRPTGRVVQHLAAHAATGRRPPTWPRPPGPAWARPSPPSRQPVTSVRCPPPTRPCAKGRLSETQVKEIAGAAILQPEAEQALVDAAGKQPLSVLKLRCRRVRATGQDQHATYDAIRRSRYLRNWTDDDGAVRLDARLTPDEGARLAAAVKAEAERLARQARRAGVDEPRQAIAADALVRPGLRGRRNAAATRPVRPDRGPDPRGNGERHRLGSAAHGPRPGRPRGPGAGPPRGRRDLRDPRHRSRSRSRWPDAWPWTRSSASWSPTGWT